MISSYRKRAEWDSYLAELNNYGLEELLEIKQKYYDHYKANQ